MRRGVRRAALCATGLAAAGCAHTDPPPVARAQATAKAAASDAPPRGYAPPAASNPFPDGPPAPDPTDTPLPINLATALQLANARPLDVQIAAKQVEAAAARYDRARLLWVPSISTGVDYFRHAGRQQNFEGNLPESDRASFMAGVGPNVVFGFSDAFYGPLAARQELAARRADRQAAANDATRDVAEAYFSVQQARGELAVALAAVRQAEELTRKTAALAKGLAPPAEANRANAELGRRRQVVAAARERWRTSAAELARLLRLDPAAVVEPAEPPSLPVTVIDPSATVDDLIPVALGARPELAGGQALVQATLARLKTERLRPLVPSLAVRSVSTNPSGTLGYGVFGGGRNGDLRNFGGRFDIDVQLLWEFQALGLGNRARVGERRAEHEAATLELFRTQDRVAAEVAAGFARVRAAAERVNAAEPALREATELAAKTVEGLGQTRRTGDVLSLVVRPQEAVAAVQAYAQAGADFYAAVADYNRAQFGLYRALGHPAEYLAAVAPPPAEPAPQPDAPAPKPAQPPDRLPVPDPEALRPAAPAPAVPAPLPVVPAGAAEGVWGPAARVPTVVTERDP
jgi:outer membrane protein TolC